MKNCKSINNTIISTFDFMVCGFVGFVYEADNDKIIFAGENIIEGNTLIAKFNGYNSIAFIYSVDGCEAGNRDAAENVIVRNNVKKSQ